MTGNLGRFSVVRIRESNSLVFITDVFDIWVTVKSAYDFENAEDICLPCTALTKVDGSDITLDDLRQDSESLMTVDSSYGVERDEEALLADYYGDLEYELTFADG